eukprot:13972857-Alexandrium_andersonii.AAC.1
MPEVFNISQLLRNLDRRISALEGRPTGVQSVTTDGPSNPVGPPPVSTGQAATGVGWNRRWTPE